MDAQRKVTCFVTRGSGAEAELLVFWHAGSAIQVPAGTVEEGEAFERAAVREGEEETGLGNLELLSRLGSRIVRLPEGRAVLKRRVLLQTRPGRNGPVTKWALTQVAVDVVAREEGFARVVYEETDADSDERLVYARFEGWVSEDCLLYKQEREFFHFRAPVGTPDSWRVLGDGEHEFHLYWVPLVPKPTLLIAPQQEWLDEFYEALVAGVQAS